MEIFSKEISEFSNTGTYDYSFDEGGNLIFNPTSTKFNQHYLSIPLKNYSYNDEKIKSFYNTFFTEFSPTKKVEIVSDTSLEIMQLNEENQQLKNKLGVLTEMSDANITESERLAIKQIIVDLRIQLKQGISDRDFSVDFPYLPITKNKR